jgi:hypothetical protein
MLNVFLTQVFFSLPKEFDKRPVWMAEYSLCDGKGVVTVSPVSNCYPSQQWRWCQIISIILVAKYHMSVTRWSILPIIHTLNIATWRDVIEGGNQFLAIIITIQPSQVLKHDLWSHMNRLSYSDQCILFQLKRKQWRHIRSIVNLTAFTARANKMAICYSTFWVHVTSFLAIWRCNLMRHAAVNSADSVEHAHSNVCTPKRETADVTETLVPMYHNIWHHIYIYAVLISAAITTWNVLYRCYRMIHGRRLTINAICQTLVELTSSVRANSHALNWLHSFNIAGNIPV